LAFHTAPGSLTLPGSDAATDALAAFLFTFIGFQIV
jgi:hypothetical protein